jgi:hypothetical protein
MISAAAAAAIGRDRKPINGTLAAIKYVASSQQSMAWRRHWRKWRNNNQKRHQRKWQLSGGALSTSAGGGGGGISNGAKYQQWRKQLINGESRSGESIGSSSEMRRQPALAAAA